jgi:hypothetical protein
MIGYITSASSASGQHNTNRMPQRIKVSIAVPLDINTYSADEQFLAV